MASESVGESSHGPSVLPSIFPQLIAPTSTQLPSEPVVSTSTDVGPSKLDPSLSAFGPNILVQQAMLLQMQAVLAQQAVQAEKDPVDQEDDTTNNEEGDNVLGADSGPPDPESSALQEKIRAHPLFSLLQVLLIKCEEATRNLNDDTVNTVEPILEAIDDLRTKHDSVRLGEPELDTLMLDAVKVLRIHLMELAKVNDLCKSFCNRYSSCIRARMNQESLLGSSGSGDSDDDSIGGDMNGLEAASNAGPIATFQTPQGTVTVPLYTPDTAPIPQSDAGEDSGAMSLPLRRLNMLWGMDLDEDPGSRGNGRRLSLPKNAVEILRTWLFQHVTNPYPTENEKRQLAQDTGLNMMQVNNWFINARRRILQPMLEGPCADLVNNSPGTKPKKMRMASPGCEDAAGTKSAMSSAQRYWPFSADDKPPCSGAET